MIASYRKKYYGWTKADGCYWLVTFSESKSEGFEQEDIMLPDGRIMNVRLWSSGGDYFVEEDIDFRCKRSIKKLINSSDESLKPYDLSQKYRRKMLFELLGIEDDLRYSPIMTKDEYKTFD